MSILIKGMEMPKNCEECEFCQLGLNAEWCYITELAIPENCITGETRQTDCPLIELPPHGRLIDADALENKGYNLVRYVYENCYTALEQTLLRAVPTIIEAEVGE